MLEDMDDDVIWSNGDVVFDEEVIKRIVEAQGNIVMVDRSECGDEEVKYRTNAANEIIEISKSVVNGEGEAVGINRISREDLPAFVQSLRDCGEQDYFEKGIEMLIGRGVFFKSMDVSDYRCIEVDFEEDLSKARNMFADYQAPAGAVADAIAF